MVYPATMESLSLKFQVSRSNGLAVVTMWSYEFSGHSSAIFVIHRKFAPYIFLESAWKGAADEPIKISKSWNFFPDSIRVSAIFPGHLAGSKSSPNMLIFGVNTY